MKCPNCGKEIANDSQFCEFCGTKINFVPSPEVPKEKPKSKKGLIIFMIILLVCCFVCIAWMTCRELTYQDYLSRIETDYDIGEKWTSSNKRDGSSSSKEYIFFMDYNDRIDIQYSVSSEENCDKLYVTLIYPNGDQSVLVEASGQQDTWTGQTVWTSGMYKLKVQYRKDGSISRYSDRASIKRVVVHRNQIKRIYWLSRDFFSL